MESTAVAPWTTEDQDPDKLDKSYLDFNTSDILERTADETILSPGTPTTETLEMFQPTTTTQMTTQNTLGSQNNPLYTEAQIFNFPNPNDSPHTSLTTIADPSTIANSTSKTIATTLNTNITKNLGAIKKSISQSSDVLTSTVSTSNPSHLHMN